MSTKIRAELSDKNPYYISKHRYYELKHFCLQYKEWESILSKPISATARAVSEDYIYTGETADPTFRIAYERLEASRKVDVVRKAAMLADNYLANYILRSVTEGLSYTYLSTVLSIPCGKDMFYDRYRKFFWILSNSCKFTTPL